MIVGMPKALVFDGAIMILALGGRGGAGPQEVRH